MKLFYVANARMPSEKAHAIQIAKMCEAFIEAGADLTLVVPRRKTVTASPREFYGLRVDIPVVYLPTIDAVSWGGYVLQAASFAVASFFYLLGKKGTVYTVDMDTFSSSLLPLTGLPVYTEMHNGKPSHLLSRLLFARAAGVIAVNRLLAEDLQRAFGSRAKFAIEPNGVDSALFFPRDKREARARLGLPQDERIVLYVGRFFDWKGLEILPEAASAVEARWQLVGGDREAFVRVTGREPHARMAFVGDVPPTDVPWWCAAADVLLVLGTKRDLQSWRYTSPMKLFEYLRMDRPVVASRTPALEEVVSAGEAVFYTPDSAADLARAVEAAFALPGPEVSIDRSWRARAERILRFIQQ